MAYTSTSSLRPDTEPRERGRVSGGAAGASAPSPDSVRAAVGIEDGLFALALVVNLAVLWCARHFPYQDPPNHLARAALIARALAGHADTAMVFRVIPSPYVAADLLTAGLVAAFGPAAGLRALAILAALALPLGMYVLIRTTAPARRGWALIGVLLMYSSYFLIGFLAYVLSIGLALVWLALWWPGRARSGVARAVLAGVGAGAVFLFHVWGALFVATVVLVDLAISAIRWARGLEPLPVSRLWTALAVLAGIAIPWMAWQWMLGWPSASGPNPEFRGMSAKVSALAYPFWGVPPWLPASLGIGYFGSLIAFAWTVRRSFHWDLYLASTAICVALYLLFPVGRGMAWDIDVRWMLPALVLPFCMSMSRVGDARPGDMSTRASRPDLVVPRTAARPWALLVPFVACVVHAVAIWQVAVRPIDRQLDDYDAVLAQVPRGRAMLPLVADHQRYGSFVNPYRHYALWRVARDDGPVGGMFEADFLADVAERHRRYTPPQRWGTSDFSPLDWDRIATDYDYIVLAGGDPRARALVAQGAHALSASGDITLFRVAARDSR